jgi:hypothetical protein
MGKDWTPAAFVSPKYKYPEPFNTPSPTQYSPEKSIYVAKGRQAPSYTFGHKASKTFFKIFDLLQNTKTLIKSQVLRIRTFFNDFEF